MGRGLREGKGKGDIFVVAGRQEGRGEGGAEQRTSGIGIAVVEGHGNAASGLKRAAVADANGKDPFTSHDRGPEVRGHEVGLRVRAPRNGNAVRDSEESLLSVGVQARGIFDLRNSAVVVDVGDAVGDLVPDRPRGRPQVVRIVVGAHPARLVVEEAVVAVEDLDLAVAVDVGHRDGPHQAAARHLGQDHAVAPSMDA